MTRRLVKPQWPKGVLSIQPQWPAQDSWRVFLDSGSSYPIRCPYGAPGDALAVKEAFAHVDGRLVFRADDPDANVKRWSPSIVMPRALSRLTLPIKAIRVERLQAITEEDARAEGVTPTVRLYRDEGGYEHEGHREAFTQIWREISGAESWEANPLVWVLSFSAVVTA